MSYNSSNSCVVWYIMKIRRNDSYRFTDLLSLILSVAPESIRKAMSVTTVLSYAIINKINKAKNIMLKNRSKISDCAKFCLFFSYLWVCKRDQRLFILNVFALLFFRFNFFTYESLNPFHNTMPVLRLNQNLFRWSLFYIFCSTLLCYLSQQQEIFQNYH